MQVCSTEICTEIAYGAMVAIPTSGTELGYGGGPVWMSVCGTEIGFGGFSNDDDFKDDGNWEKDNL
eukprot:680002-Rhodomonas_salina.1